ncbi:MAG: hypothetical protein PUE18_01655 [Firmicutes bacterium]|nr:hypothetical protein [Bacillota bacterium]
MNSKFTREEKQKFKLIKHIKDHLFEYILDVVGIVLVTLLVLYLLNREDKFIFGIAASLVYGIIKTIYKIYCYKKDYLNRE